MRALRPLLAVASLLMASTAEAQSWRTLDVSRQLADTAPMLVRLEYEIGTLTLRPAASTVLYGARLRYDAAKAQPVYEFTPATRMLRLGVERRQGGQGKDGEAGELRLELTRRAPLDLELRLGAVEADLDLGGLRLDHLKLESGASDATVRFDQPNPERMRSLSLAVGAASLKVARLANANAEQVRVQAGIGAVELDFGGQWSHDVELTLEMALGGATLRVPRDVGIQVDATRRLASFDLPGLVRRGDQWVSPNFESAKYKLRVRGRMSAGALTLEQGD